MTKTKINVEQRRLAEAGKGTPWRKWGPYLSERQWGTVREDYSESGDAWNYFPHDQARSRAYRWGEDGDTGAGVGASHQTGWSGAIARIGHLFASFKAHEILEGGKEKGMGKSQRERRTK